MISRLPLLAIGLPAIIIGSSPALAQNTIKIGELNSYKSQPAFLEPYKKGIDLAVQEINASGGVLGNRFEVISRDDGGNPGDAVRVAEELLARESVGVLAGIHPKAGGSGKELCSGDMLLEALIACAGVSMRAAAAVLDIPIKSALVTAEGDVDLRGTLGVTEGVAVGFKEIRLRFDIDTDAPQQQLDQLIDQVSDLNLQAFLEQKQALFNRKRRTPLEGPTP